MIKNATRTSRLWTIGAVWIAAACGSGDGSVPRTYERGRFTSAEMPAIEIDFAGPLEDIGAVEFSIEGVAEGVRHHLVASDGSGGLDYLIVLHFERRIDDKTYNYGIPGVLGGPDYRFSAQPVRLGRHDYIHNTWFFDATAAIEEAPDGELAATADVLERAGYRLPAGVAMSRFVRVVDDEQKHEFILFYIEPLGRTGYEVSDFTDGGEAAREIARLSRDLKMRSLRTFEVVIGR